MELGNFPTSPPAGPGTTQLRMLSWMYFVGVTAHHSREDSQALLLTTAAGVAVGDILTIFV